MLTFWLLAGLMVFAAGAVVAVPLWRHRPATTLSQDTVNVRLFQERLAELELEQQAGRLDAGHYRQLRQELERTLLVDVHAPKPQAAPSGRPPLKVATVTALLVPLLALSYYYVTSYQGEARDWINLQDQLDEVVARTVQQADDLPPAAQQDLPAFTRVLQARVLKEGLNNPDSLYLLGRCYLGLGQPRGAELVLHRAYALEPQRTDIMLTYAQAMIMAEDGRLSEASTQLLQNVLKVNPHHQGALMLLGFGAFNNGAYAQAVQSWRQLLALLDPASEGARLVSRSIARAEELQTQASQPAAADTGGPRIAVTVDLAPALRERLSPQDTLFIFAKAASGPPMPLAAVRQAVADFPVQVVLDDSRAVVPALKLSSFKQVVVSARISKSGGVTAQAGDLQGAPIPLEVQGGSQSVALTIDQVVQ